MLNIAVERSHDVVQLKCAGRLVHGSESEVLRHAVEQESARTVAIDLADLSTVDAAGLGTLVYLHRQLEKQERELILVSAPDYFLRLLRLTNLDGVLTVRDWCAA
jgi:anti-anti-sigma factor